MSDFGFDARQFETAKYKTHVEARRDLKQKCEEVGFTFKKKRDNSHKHKDKQPTQFDYTCSKAGVYTAYLSQLIGGRSRRHLACADAGGVRRW